MEEAEPSSTALHRITLSGLTTVIAELERRIPAQCAFFTQLMRESWQPEDSLAEQNGFEPPVPVVRSEAASSCQFQFLRHD